MAGELTPHDLTTDEFVAAILEEEQGFGLMKPLRDTNADPAGRAVNSHTSENEVKVFARHGIRCRRKASGVREGCVLLMDALAHPALALVVSSRCHWTIEALSSVPPDPHQPERHDERSPYTHVLAALRYFAVNGPAVGRPRGSGGVGYDECPRPRMEF